MQALLHDIANCNVCKPHLPLGCRPVVSASPNSRIVIIGQAPGLKVHQTGIPWDDASGRNLRQWLAVTDEQFYNPNIFALIPMGFCYPGKGKSGDLPPRPECAPLWHHRLLQALPQVELTLLVGQYAQQHYLQHKAKATLTETVQNYTSFLPQYLPLPHPSPRNNIWQARNPWFQASLIPQLRRIVAGALK